MKEISQMAHHYQLAEPHTMVVPNPLRGRYLSRSLQDKKVCAFIGADLYRGIAHLVEPSLTQSALLSGSDVTAVWWALRREKYRDEIIRGLLPLVPPRQKAPPVSAPKSNGCVQLELFEINDAELINLARRVGPQRMLEAACAAENGR
jgi:hypothetical protein